MSMPMPEAKDVAGQAALTGFLPHIQHNTEATSTSLRFWARSIGDRNVRHVADTQDRTRARLVAHPCWLYSVHDTVLDIGDSDMVPIIAGTKWTFVRPVVPGDAIHTLARLLDQRPVRGRHAGDSLLQTVEIQYLGAHDETIAIARSTLMRVVPEACRRMAKHGDWRRWKYTTPELMAIEVDYDHEICCGAQQRYLEDVAQGEALPSIVRGPITSEEMVLFVGATCPVPAVGAFTALRRDGRAASFVHARSGTYETPAAGFVDDESARELGFPAAHDYGIDRIAQLASLVGNWIGDHGRLARLDARLVEPRMLGDTIWLKGDVVSVRKAGPRHGLVEIRLLGVNQRGQVTVAGTAEVELPMRHMDVTPHE